MIGLNWLAIIVATVIATFASAIYYVALSPKLRRLSNAYQGRARPSTWIVVATLVRTLIVAVVVAGLVNLLAITNLGQATLLAIALWIAFPVVLLSGSVIHENLPWRLAAIHAGDWLVKLMLVAGIVTVWQ